MVMARHTDMSDIAYTLPYTDACRISTRYANIGCAEVLTIPIQKTQLQASYNKCDLKSYSSGLVLTTESCVLNLNFLLIIKVQYQLLFPETWLHPTFVKM